jgi:MGT family glycosyltransferase
VLGRELSRRGHQLVALNIPDIGPACEEQDLAFRAVGGDVMPPGSWEEYWTPIATSTGLRAIRATARAHRMVTRAMCSGVPEAHREQPFDALLIDQIQFQGRTIADHLGVPFVTLAPFIPMHRDPSGNRPPPFLPFDQARGRRTLRLVNRLGYEVLELLARPVMKETNEFARRWGQPEVKRVADTFSPTLQMTQCPPALDFVDPATTTTRVHYVGSLLDADRPSVAFPYDRLDASRPLVYVSLGTLQNQRPEIYRAVLDALDQLPVQGVISLGRWRGGGEPPVRSERHVVVDYAPQQELIARAAVVVTHAGMNTTIEALAAGAPLVLVPITNDQPAVAKRVELLGAGVRVPLAKLNAARLRQAIATVLDDPAHRAAAQAQQAGIESAGGVRRAADLIEESLLPAGARRS